MLCRSVSQINDSFHVKRCFTRQVGTHEHCVPRKKFPARFRDRDLLRLAGYCSALGYLICIWGECLLFPGMAPKGVAWKIYRTCPNSQKKKKKKKKLGSGRHGVLFQVKMRDMPSDNTAPVQLLTFGFNGEKSPGPATVASEPGWRIDNGNVLFVSPGTFAGVWCHNQRGKQQWSNKQAFWPTLIHWWQSLVDCRRKLKLNCTKHVRTHWADVGFSPSNFAAFEKGGKQYRSSTWFRLLKIFHLSPPVCYPSHHWECYPLPWMLSPISVFFSPCQGLWSNLDFVFKHPWRKFVAKKPNDGDTWALHEGLFLHELYLSICSSLSKIPICFCFFVHWKDVSDI